MKFTYVLTALVIASSSSFLVADENHEIIEIVMKEGMKGDDSPLSKILDGKGSKEDSDNLLKFVEMLEGTKAPVGDQKAYDAKVAKLIAAAKKIAELNRLSVTYLSAPAIWPRSPPSAVSTKLPISITSNQT